MSAPQPPDGQGPPSASDATGAPRPTGRRPTDVAAVPRPIFLDAMVAQHQQQQQRASLSSMLFFTFFFFMMSGGNGGNQEMIIGDHRLLEPDYLQGVVSDYVNYLNHTSSNYSYPLDPDPAIATLIPPHLRTDEHSPSLADPVFYTNVTGFYRNADAHYLNLTDPGSSPSIRSFFRHLLPNSMRSEQKPQSLTTRVVERLQRRRKDAPDHVVLPSLKQHPAAFNETVANEARGTWDWTQVSGWDLNLEERPITPGPASISLPIVESTNLNASDWEDWSWVHCSLSFLAPSKDAITYRLQGMHHKPTGVYRLLGKPRDLGYDIRHLPTMYETRHREVVSQAVLWELQKRLQKLQDAMFFNVHEEDDPFPVTTCTLHLELRLLPLPEEYTSDMLRQYETEVRNPTGITLSPPPAGIKMEGIALLDGCGLAFGLDNGNGLEADEFWRKSIHYAAFALVVNLVILILFVRQMEATRTPSSLAKVSFWTIAMMISADSWQFSAHVVIGIMSNDKTSLPMLLPGFFCLCTAVIFGPRFAVLLYRVQAPESTRRRPPNRQAAIGETEPLAAGATAETPTRDEPRWRPVWNEIRDEMESHPQGKWLAIFLLVLSLTYFGLIPQVIPLFLGAIYSFWLPQIWRNARRGTRKATSWSFVIGSSMARLALPLYAFACPQNVFFVETTDWVWLLVAWQWFQILVLLAQDRINPAFFLPKRFAPPEAYDYHPVMPANDSESQMQKFGDCSICMEPILVEMQPDHSPASSKTGQAPSAVGAVGSRVISMQMRRTYALAPCHHMFHTACLAQWLAVKNVCPLCKRTLPPL